MTPRHAINSYGCTAGVTYLKQNIKKQNVSKTTLNRHRLNNYILIDYIIIFIIYYMIKDIMSPTNSCKYF